MNQKKNYEYFYFADLDAEQGFHEVMLESFKKNGGLLSIPDNGAINTANTANEKITTQFMNSKVEFKNYVGLGQDVGGVEFSFSDPNIYCSQDVYVENVHFSVAYFNVEQIAYKSLAGSLSDLAAAGVNPIGFMITLAVPEKYLQNSFFDEFYKGLAKLSKKFQVPLMGGDLSRISDTLVVDISVFGIRQSTKKIRTRKGCQNKDLIYLTGFPGLSELGRHLLQNIKKSDSAWDHLFTTSEAFKKHLMPEPRFDISNQLNIYLPDSITSCMDTSDDLLKSLNILARQNNALIRIQLDQFQIHPEIMDPTKNNFNSQSEKEITAMLAGGEDYELLFTTSLENAEIIKKISNLTSTPIVCIGQVQSICTSKQDFLNNQVGVIYCTPNPISEKYWKTISGWNHF